MNSICYKDLVELGRTWLDKVGVRPAISEGSRKTQDQISEALVGTLSHPKPPLRTETVALNAVQCYIRAGFKKTALTVRTLMEQQLMFRVFFGVPGGINQSATVELGANKHTILFFGSKLGQILIIPSPV